MSPDTYFPNQWPTLSHVWPDARLRVLSLGAGVQSTTLGFSRQDCLKYLEERQYPKPPKSACIGCPFHTNAMWRELRDNEPEEWADAVAADRALRTGDGYKMRGREFMHRSCLPLDQATIDSDDPRQLGFDLDCEGMCGV